LKNGIHGKEKQRNGRVGCEDRLERRLPLFHQTSMIGRRCYVSGRVQGVYYRASARQRALDLGVTGYARNLPDGRVEAFVCGDESAVAEMIRWLHVGPPAASVTRVDVEVVESFQVPADFLTT
jgi:acylphosphatase